jgi:acetylglutamate/LysW-gamma-L-alpha-aminoadipate kinase
MLLVVKLGGSILRTGTSSELVQDLKEILEKNKIVFVHGGGSEVTEVASKLGKEQRFIISPQGFRSRYTDKETIEIFTMVMAGKMNKNIVLALEKQGIATVGLSGLDGFLLKALRKKRLIIVDERGRKKVIDGGYTGKIIEINTDLLWLILKKNYTPVITPIAISKEYEPLNVDGDRTAAAIASSLKADKLILMTDVDGLILNKKFVPKIKVSEIKSILPEIGQGMSTKVHASIGALNNGVKEVIITSGSGKKPLSSALNHKRGTVISHE